MEHKTIRSATARDESASHAQETAGVDLWPEDRTEDGSLHNSPGHPNRSAFVSCTSQAALAAVWFERAFICWGSRIFCSTHDLLWTSGTRRHRLLPGISNKSYMWAYGLEQTHSLQSLYEPQILPDWQEVLSSRSVGGCSFVSSAQVDAGSTFVVHFTGTQLQVVSSSYISTGSSTK